MDLVFTFKNISFNLLGCIKCRIHFCARYCQAVLDSIEREYGVQCPGFDQNWARGYKPDEIVYLAEPA